MYIYIRSNRVQRGLPKSTTLWASLIRQTSPKHCHLPHKCKCHGKSTGGGAGRSLDAYPLTRPGGRCAKTSELSSPDKLLNIGPHDVVHHQLLLCTHARISALVCQHPPLPEVVWIPDVLDVYFLNRPVFEFPVQGYRRLAGRWLVAVAAESQWQRRVIDFTTTPLCSMWKRRCQNAGIDATDMGRMRWGRQESGKCDSRL